MNKNIKRVLRQSKRRKNQRTINKIPNGDYISTRSMSDLRQSRPGDFRKLDQLRQRIGNQELYYYINDLPSPASFSGA